MKRAKRKRRCRAAGRPADEGSYVCPTCGEQIVIPVDPSQGNDQRYVEDCPVCCHPNVVVVEFDPAWDTPRVSAEPE